MPAQLPKLADTSDRIFRKRQITVVLGDLLGGSNGNIRGGESGEGKIQAGFMQRQQLGAHKRLVPAGCLSQTVVRQDVGSALGVRQMLDQHARSLRHAFGLGRSETAMAGDHVAGGVDQHRRHKAELPKGAPELVDLRRAVRPGVVGIGDQLGDLPNLQPGGHLHGASIVRGTRPRIASVSRARF